MKLSTNLLIVCVVCAVLLLTGCATRAAPPAAAITTPAPTTKMEAFKPMAGSVVTLGIERLGNLSSNERGYLQTNGKYLSHEDIDKMEKRKQFSSLDVLPKWAHESKDISVEVREFRHGVATTDRVCGLLIWVREKENHRESSFVDADEIPELLKGLDALLEIKTNPTHLNYFEVAYTTRGEFKLTAFQNYDKDHTMSYAVQAGRGVPTQVVGLSVTDMQAFRDLLNAALQKLQSL